MYRPRHGMKASGLARWMRTNNNYKRNNYSKYKYYGSSANNPLTGNDISIILFGLSVFAIIILGILSSIN